MLNRTLAAAAALLVASALPASAATAKAPEPSQTELKATIEKLVSFGTRHTLSSATDPKRGIGAARRWMASRFEAIGKDCAGCLKVEMIGDTVSGPRAPEGVYVDNVVAFQPGTTDPTRVIVIIAHIDSRVSDVMNFTADAPGANDDASGVALVTEAARILSKEKFPATIVYAALSGEEQGLWGARILEKELTKRGYKIAAVLNNDVVGNTTGIGGEKVDDTVRVFSEGISLARAEDPAAIRMQRMIGGEDDSGSRALAKAIVRITEAQPSPPLKILAVRRPDRFQRGGDHTAFLEAGHPAIRFSEVAEHYDRQHQDLRNENGRHFGDTIEFIDFPYLAKVTAVNLAVARELARAPGAPATASLTGAVTADTTVSWAAVPGAAKYRVHWRKADTFAWTDHRDVPATETSLFLKGVNIDYHFFGVSAVAADGSESLVTFAGVPPRPAPGAVR